MENMSTNEQHLFWANDPLQVVKNAQKTREILTGVVYKVETVDLPGGKVEKVTMDLGGIKGFCSQDEFDVHNYRTLAGFIGHSVNVCVTDIITDPKTNEPCAIVSRKLAQSIKGKKVRETLKEGEIVNGTISGFNDKDGKATIFINIGGVDTFCYLEDWDYTRIPNIRDVGVMGQPVTVFVKKIVNTDPFVVRVSRKEASKDPWEGIANEFSVQSNVLGKITNISPEYGIFVSIKRGVTVRGIIPKKSNLPAPIPGLPVRGVLVEMDEKSRRGKLIITTYPHGAPTKRANPGSYLFE
jgi:small subunit ribosomal protein S1